MHVAARQSGVRQIPSGFIDALNSACAMEHPTDQAGDLAPLPLPELPAPVRHSAPFVTPWPVIGTVYHEATRMWPAGATDGAPAVLR